MSDEQKRSPGGTPAGSSEEYSPMDFVYTGLRLNAKGERFVSVRVVLDAGTLGDEMLFQYSRSRDLNVGGVYRGAHFSKSGARGLDKSHLRYSGRWSDEGLRIQWSSLHDAAEAERRVRAMEAEEGRVSDLEKALLPARQLYDSLRRRYDKAGLAALEQAVLAALRTPPRKVETKD